MGKVCRIEEFIWVELSPNHIPYFKYAKVRFEGAVKCYYLDDYFLEQLLNKYCAINNKLIHPDILGYGLRSRLHGTLLDTKIRINRVCSDEELPQGAKVILNHHIGIEKYSKEFDRVLNGIDKEQIEQLIKNVNKIALSIMARGV